MKRIRLDSSSSSSASSPKRELSFKPEKETMMTSETTGSERTTEMVFSDQKDFSLTFCGRGSEFISFSNFSCLVRASTSKLRFTVSLRLFYEIVNYEVVMCATFPFSGSSRKSFPSLSLLRFLNDGQKVIHTL